MSQLLETISSAVIRRYAPDHEQAIDAAIARAASTHRWDKVIFWNRVRWRLKFLNNRTGRVPSLLCDHGLSG